MAYTVEVEPASYISLDIFPGAVHENSPDNPPLGEEYRVIVTDNYLYVIMEGLTAPEFKVKASLLSMEGTNKTGYTVYTTQGVYFVQRAGNCGCGSRLRGLHLFPGVPYESQLPKGK